jgi:hypothetical protein
VLQADLQEIVGSGGLILGSVLALLAHYEVPIIPSQPWQAAFSVLASTSRLDHPLIFLTIEVVAVTEGCPVRPCRQVNRFG